ncbi:MAG TPA: MarP family serine protease [Micromonosporaceae bacterium]|jgi:S1-C subfamily serine protease
MPGSVVDLVLIALIILFGINGYRQGFLVGALSFVGFFGGALVGLQIAPWVVGSMTGAFARVLVSLSLVFGLALLGQSAAAWAGGRLRGAISNEHGQRADDIGGVVVSVLALLMVSWMVAVPLASSPLPGLSRSVRNSAILHVIDGLVPDPARALYSRLQDTIAGGDFPKVFGDLTPTESRQVPEPDPALLKLAAVEKAHPSVVKVTGTAPSCRRRIEGSGFVYAPEHVITNAHVVAGTRGPITVEAVGGSRAGRVVYYDPDRDLAVIDVPGLKAPALPFAEETAASGTDAIVVGYPLDGPFTPVAARVRDRFRVRGPNIYENKDVVRWVYTLRTTVRSGNSGGPLLDTDGRVLGVIFAAALDESETGFALTPDEVLPVADAASSLSDPVDTGACT